MLAERCNLVGMTRAEAEEYAARLQAEHADRATHRFLPHRSPDGSWSVAKLLVPKQLCNPPLRATAEARPRPAYADDGGEGTRGALPAFPAGSRADLVAPGIAAGQGIAHHIQEVPRPPGRSRASPRRGRSRVCRPLARCPSRMGGAVAYPARRADVSAAARTARSAAWSSSPRALPPVSRRRAGGRQPEHSPSQVVPAVIAAVPALTASGAAGGRVRSCPGRTSPAPPAPFAPTTPTHSPSSSARRRGRRARR